MAHLLRVLVLGLGVMGSAAAYQLARRGHQVLGIEQFTPAHNRGSSHGKTRAIRQAYFEGSDYVPLVRRSYQLWRELERQTGQELLTITGGLLLGDLERPQLKNSIRSARDYGLAFQILDAADVRRRYPALQPVADEGAFYEREAGVLFAEDAVRALQGAARAHGAELRFTDPVQRWEATTEGGVKVISNGRCWVADRLVITAGAWAGAILQELCLPLQVERNVHFWFNLAVPPEAVGPERLPIFGWDRPERNFYGFPALHDHGLKVAFHHGGGSVRDPSALERAVTPAEVEEIEAWVHRFLPGVAGSLRAHAACMYTNTPDHHFVLGVHPLYPQVAIAAGFSGHGFKFAPVVGEVLADLVSKGETQHPIGAFRPDRFAPTSPQP